METRKSKNGKRILKGAAFAACLAMTVALFNTSVAYGSELKINALVSTTKENEEVYYIGKVTGGVNVRVGAGAEKDQLIVGDQAVKLNKGTEVTILSEVKVGKKPWYEIRFTFNEQEVVGFATSSYIEKTATTVTPTVVPTSTPVPSLTPTPVPTAIPTVEPSLVPTEVPKETGDSSVGSTALWIFGGVAMVALGIVLTMTVQKKRKEEFAEANEVSKKVEKLKNMVITKELEDSNEDYSEGKRKSEARFTKEGRPARQPAPVQHTSEVYVKTKAAQQKLVPVAEELAATSEVVADTLPKKKEVGSKESEGKSELRKAIQELREHDIVIHKYFGKGEVYDNSDVKLIEVRFGLDARFLNKDQLAAKKLLEITNERRR